MGREVMMHQWWRHRKRIYAIIEMRKGRWICVGYERWQTRPACQYRIDADRWGNLYCNCPAPGDCKHMFMLLDKRRGVGLWYDPETDVWSKERLV
jgi:hypothetical protein